jgi:hypothetical protein
MTIAVNALTNLGSITDPADLEQLFGPPPAFTSEETKRHRQIFRAFAQVVKPRDYFERADLWDLAHWRIEIQRAQRVIAGLPKEAHKANRERRALAIVLDAASKKEWARAAADAELEAEIKNLKCKPEEVEAQSAKLKAASEKLKAERIDKIEADERKALQVLTAEYAADTDCVASFGTWIDNYERANKCLEFAQKQYDQTRRRLEQYRSGLGELLRRVNDTVIEGEFQEDIVEERETAAPEVASAAAVAVDAERAAATASPNGLAGAAPATAAALPGRAAPTEDGADSQYR